MSLLKKIIGVQPGDRVRITPLSAVTYGGLTCLTCRFVRTEEVLGWVFHVLETDEGATFSVYANQVNMTLADD